MQFISLIINLYKRQLVVLMGDLDWNCFNVYLLSNTFNYIFKSDILFSRRMVESSYTLPNFNFVCYTIFIYTEWFSGRPPLRLFYNLIYHTLDIHVRFSKTVKIRKRGYFYCIVASGAFLSYKKIWMNFGAFADHFPGPV